MLLINADIPSETSDKCPSCSRGDSGTSLQVLRKIGQIKRTIFVWAIPQYSLRGDICTDLDYTQKGTSTKHQSCMSWCNILPGFHVLATPTYVFWDKLVEIQ